MLPYFFSGIYTCTEGITLIEKEKELLTEITDLMTVSLGRNHQKLFLTLTATDGRHEVCVVDPSFHGTIADTGVGLPTVWIYGKDDITRVVAHFKQYNPTEGKIVIWQNQETLDFATLFAHKEVVEPGVLTDSGNVEVRLLESGTLLISVSSAAAQKKYTVVVDQSEMITATLIETKGETK
jgi:hypothetical protein